MPVLDEAAELPAVLDHLAGLGGDLEVVVVDGGSRDATVARARAHPSRPRVLQTGPGRAGQLNRGAREADGELLVFLHADSRLPPDAAATLRGVARDPNLLGGNFDLRFDGDDQFSRWLTRIYRLQRRWGYYYGDSTLWVRRAHFDRLGGFRALPVMDDYDFVRRLEASGRTVCLPGPALTSARRWRRLGPARTALSWWVIRGLYLLGVPPTRLAGLYRRVR